MRSLLLSMSFLLLAQSAHAARAVMEGIRATKATILIDTGTARVHIGTGSYIGGIPTVGLFTTSNVVVGTNSSTNNIVLYSTGSIMLNGAAVATSGGSSTQTFIVISSYIDVAMESISSAGAAPNAVTTQIIASCSSGKQATGGGCKRSGEGGSNTHAWVQNIQISSTAWTCQFNNGTGSNETLTASVFCGRFR